VILLDVTILTAAHWADQSHHGAVTPWFRAITQGDETFTVPDVVWASFVRITTNRRIFPVPTWVDEAFSFLRAVRAQPNHVALVAGEAHLALFERLCREDAAVGDLAADAYIAALALEHDCELVTLDRDVARFRELRWRTPPTV
jgi:toxin-antitoxin system PIN domain toxin